MFYKPDFYNIYIVICLDGNSHFLLFHPEGASQQKSSFPSLRGGQIPAFQDGFPQHLDLPLSYIIDLVLLLIILLLWMITLSISCQYIDQLILLPTGIDNFCYN